MELPHCTVIRRALAFSALLLFATSAFSSGADAPNSTWTEVTPSNGLPARAFFATAYDPVSRKVVVFGGSDASGQLNDTWIYDGNSWIQVPTPVAPGPRAAAAMAYDLSSRKIVLFG